MIALFVGGIFFIVIGVASILFPDRLTNRFDGVSANQGEAGVAGRVLRGLGLILAGVALLLLPVILW